MPIAPLAALLLAATSPPAAATADPPRDAVHPATMAAFVIPAQDGAMNAVLYRAAGAGPHPMLLLLHGFPGNEQNLDLGQAARRAGWSVLTLHYRGSWGSPGRFTFAGAADDARTAIAFLRANAERYGIDPRRMAVAGHSMGGMMAARAAADDKALLGAFLIDPWDMAGSARFYRSDAAARQDFIDNELRGDLPPLAGTSEAALLAELDATGPRLDLPVTIREIGRRPVAMVYAERGNGTDQARSISRAAGLPTPPVLPTDHSFSDMRIALATRLVEWLATLPR
ncbi:alpha/beta hydrolase [Sphingomonas jatrophae]|uniref:Alpha/beta hydrolase family protein n=1 Tax=Sphingomonas jatrophae TaxID=1166337 RepID=A0A1I6JQC0_9SPHN|nr:alpha/beta hydrolase [Sphingomonas jatrophae]SFR81182.1 Alpha/beta hydrolase family protein [Sphingomonas jatrophae]